MNNRRHLLSRALKGRAETFGVIGEYTRAITDFNVIATVSVVENNLIQRFGTIDIYIKQGEVTSALHVIKQAINTSESRNRPFERLKFLSKKVTALHRIGRLRSAMDLAHATLDALKKYRNNHRSNEDIAKQIMGLLATMGNIYFALDECAHALQYHTRAHTMCLALDDIQMNGVILSNMCLVYWKMKSYDKAIECGSKSLAIGKQIGDVRAVSISLNNIGLIYDEMGDYDSGLKYFEQALTHFQKVGDKYGIGITFFNIASYHKEISGNLQAAENFFERSYIIQKEIADSYGTVDNETMLAQIYHVAHKRK